MVQLPWEAFFHPVLKEQLGFTNTYKICTTSKSKYITNTHNLQMPLQRSKMGFFATAKKYNNNNTAFFPNKLG